MRRPPRYRTEDGHVLIELRLRNTRQLFDERDPAPFRERDLNDDAVDYLVGAVEEFPLRKPLRLVLRFADESNPPYLDPEELADAIRAHFEYEAELTRRRRQRLMREGQLWGLTALVMLFGCLSLATVLDARMAPGHLREALKEGLVILGWVALWRPVDTFLFDGWPYLRRMRYLRKIAGLAIEVEYE